MATFVATHHRTQHACHLAVSTIFSLALASSFVLIRLYQRFWVIGSSWGGTMIEEPAMIDAIIDTRQQIDFLWQFFVTVQIAIFALLFIYDRAVENMNFVAKIMGLAGIALFSWINGNALANTYLLLDSMVQQYAVWYGTPGRFEPGFLEHFVQASYTDRPQLVLMTHTMAFAVVLLALLTRKLLRPKHK